LGRNKRHQKIERLGAQIRKLQALQAEMLLSRNQYYEYQGEYLGLHFKPSVFKKDRVLQFITTNLQLQSFTVFPRASASSVGASPAELLTTTCGAFTAFGLGYSQGGLAELGQRVDEMQAEAVAMSRQPDLVMAAGGLEAVVSPALSSPTTMKETGFWVELDRMQLDLHLRTNVCFSQALCCVVTAFLATLQRCSKEQLELIALCGFVFQMECLLSTIGVEASMISDMAVTFNRLQQLRIILVQIETEDDDAERAVKDAEASVNFGGDSSATSSTTASSTKPNPGLRTGEAKQASAVPPKVPPEVFVKPLTGDSEMDYCELPNGTTQLFKLDGNLYGDCLVTEEQQQDSRSPALDDPFSFLKDPISDDEAETRSVEKKLTRKQTEITNIPTDNEPFELISRNRAFNAEKSEKKKTLRPNSYLQIKRTDAAKENSAPTPAFTSLPKQLPSLLHPRCLPSDLLLVLRLPSETFARLPNEFTRVDGARPVIRLVPLLLQQGVDAMQTVADNLGNNHIQDVINKQVVVNLCTHLERLSALDEVHQRWLAPAFEALNKFKESLEHQPSKNINLLKLLDRAVRSLPGSARAICCKSGKDRTSMSVTWAQTCFLESHDAAVHTAKPLASSKHFASTLDVMRSDGVRRDCVEINVGKRFFAFNPLQRTALPEMLQPPAFTCANVQG